jgi:hypothetical protein
LIAAAGRIEVGHPIVDRLLGDVLEAISGSPHQHGGSAAMVEAILQAKGNSDLDALILGKIAASQETAD